MTAGTLSGALSLLDPVGAEGTLDDMIVALWEDLGADRRVDCPVCGGVMRPAYTAHAHAIGATCSACGSSVQ